MMQQLELCSTSSRNPVCTGGPGYSSSRCSCLVGERLEIIIYGNLLMVSIISAQSKNKCVGSQLSCVYSDIQPNSWFLFLSFSLRTFLLLLPRPGILLLIQYTYIHSFHSFSVLFNTILERALFIWRFMINLKAKPSQALCKIICNARTFVFQPPPPKLTSFYTSVSWNTTPLPTPLLLIKHIFSSYPYPFLLPSFLFLHSVLTPISLPTNSLSSSFLS